MVGAVGSGNWALGMTLDTSTCSWISISGSISVAAAEIKRLKVHV